MFKKFIQSGRTLVLVSAITLTTIMPVQKANAAIGYATGSLPILIVGMAWQGFGPCLATSIWTVNNPYPIPRWVGLFHLVSSIGYFVALDEENFTATLQRISPQMAKEIGLNTQEHIAYNQAIQNGDIDAILQTAVQEYVELKDETLDSAGAIMNNLTSVLDTDARTAFKKISTHIALTLASNYESMQ